LLVELFVHAVTLYAAVGTVFAIAFVAWGVSHVDTHAEGAGLGFRLMIFPGVAALWPLLLNRWLRVRRFRVQP
jgi:hypothetical protein